MPESSHSAAPPSDISWRDVRLPGVGAGSGYVVLGAAGAIGSQVVRALLEAGAGVMATARSTAALERLAGSIGPADRSRLSLQQVDVVDMSSASRAFERAAAELGGVRGVVNCAATGDDGMTGSAPDADRARAILEVNVLGTMLPAAAAFPHLGRYGTGASLVNMASIAAYRSHGAGVAYSASKAAVLRITRQLAVEWGPAGVRVNCVSPGQTPTKIRGLDDPVGSPPRAQPTGPSRPSDVPLSRFGTLDDYAGPTLFLLSDLARYVNGQDILVDGGLSWRRFSTA
jgi:NAD(P)-dependent dehydrogenase (short-subunit alcohol dehydrogenase family)